MLKTFRRVFGHRNPVRLLWHKTRAIAALVLYRLPARKLYVIGITGTDGKTTTVGMTAHILSQSGIRTGALSTAYMRIGDKEQWNETQKTSPSPFVIQKFLRNCVRAGCTHVVLECSSHGLVQSRLLGIWPTVAAITNTSEEHLDYHGTMERYRKDKGRLFGMLKGKGTKVLNRDDATFEMYGSIPSLNTVTYSASSPDATLTLSEVEVTPHGSSAVVHSEEADTSAELELTIPGGFNLENALCAIGATHSLCTLDEACKALASYKSAPARMEMIDEGQPFSVYVDFTVTPEAFRKTLGTLRDMIEPGKRIIVLTGSCGDRMKEKRPIVGSVCCAMADSVIITNDEPYTEDPQQIIDEVWSGIDQTQCKAIQIPDRKEAITYACTSAQAGDAVLLCGLGSYPYVMMKDGPVPWNEQEETRAILRTL